MANPQKRKGDRWEVACIKYFKLWGFDLVRTKAGAQNDKGDVAGDDLCAYELRDRKNISVWQAQRDARRHADDARKKVGVAVVKQAQKPVGEALVVLSFEDWMLVRSLIERESVDAKAKRLSDRHRVRAKRADPEYVAQERVKNADSIRARRLDVGFRQDERNKQAISYATQSECERRARVQRQGARRRAREFGAPFEDYVSPLLCPDAVCVCCGAREDLSCDHVVPLHLGADGPGDVLQNLAVMCRRCNISKGRGVACRLVH